MSTPQNTASPSRPPHRAPQQQPKRDSQGGSNPGAKQSPRRQRGNRANNRATADPNAAANASDSAIVDYDSAVLSGEEVQFKGRRNGNIKKHTQSQPASDRVVSTNISTSPPDTARGPNNTSATPAKPTPAKHAAYAGASFAASPAPSSLPMPKFLSKSVPAEARVGPANPLEESSESGSPPSPSPPTPSRASIPIPHAHGGGAATLNALFQADREERARKGSPRSVAFSPNPTPIQNGGHYAKNDSAISMNGIFPIELDGDNRYTSPPPGPLSGYRSVTAPSRIPQVMGSPQMDRNVPPYQDQADGRGSPVVQDLLNRLVQSPNNQMNSTPPRTVERMPSDPASRQTPSPFYNPGAYNPGSAPRSASGPSTPVSSAQQQSSDLHYGNRNLSPLFKAAQSEKKRNSMLRTEITPDSPIMPPQLGFPSPSPVQTRDAHNNQHAANNYNQAASNVHPPNNAPTGPRNGNVQPIPPFRESPNNVNRRTPGRRFPNNRTHSNPNYKEATAVTSPKPAAINPFIPSSVQAKRYSTPTKPKPTFTDPPPAISSSESMEQQLKRMLNLNNTPDMTGVR